MEKLKNDEYNITNLKELIELMNAGMSLASASKYLSKKKNISKNIIYKLQKEKIKMNFYKNFIHFLFN